MIDGNISMEEDTELRDLVVQTLENNGVLAKLRAELRASVFLALEEQETVANPEPLLNETVKQYLGNEDGKLLFSLVREFLEYFGLDYTISVYDSETYFGKEYNYPGRNKLSEQLGISTNEPLLGEILKSSINGAFNNTQKSSFVDSRLNKTNETSTNFSNATFEISVPKVIHTKESTSYSNDNDSSDKVESISVASPDLPINVTITDKKTSVNDTAVDTSSSESPKKSTLRVKNESFEEENQDSESCDGTTNNNVLSKKLSVSPNNQNLTTNNSRKQETKADKDTNIINKSEQLIKFDESIDCEKEINQNEEFDTKQRSTDLRITNNAQNIKIIDAENNFEKTVFFEEIIVDGKRQKVGDVRKSETLLGELPPLAPKSNSIFRDLPPLNGKKTNINDLKELMDIGLGGGDAGDNYEEDFVSSASGSANEQSPVKESDVESPDRSGTMLKKMKQQERSHSTRGDELSEEIDEIEEVFSNASCLEDTSGDNGISNFTKAITVDCNDDV
ncbi:uncharacterized protein [Venturia canescens]|uniref:uncharacterized protein n=1 Tax=Venturia canescens TaxID=32260 RepID=UPI001C9C056C|nr:uncharacterized protein LOC122410014 [Venturia canescens]